MINLIPTEALHDIKREYWIRVFSVWAFLLGSAFFIVAILHIPVHSLLRAQKEGYQQAYTIATEQTGEFKVAEEAIKNSNAVASLLTKKDEQVLFSSVLTTIDTLVPKGVQVASYTFERKGVELGQIKVSGSADSRTSLSAFKNAIESDALFKLATIPLSDLAKDKNIPFTLSITPHASTTPSS